MTTFAELQNQSDQRKLVRKIQKAVALIAPRDVELPETLFPVSYTHLRAHET